MHLKLIRHTRTDNSTIGTLSQNGKPICKILEDVDRGLSSQMPLPEILRRKVLGKTAIPSGTYTVAITMSNRFARLLPILNNVPGFEGIRIHPGNTPADTEGCLLPGLSEATDFVGSSRDAFATVYKLIDTAIKRGEKVSITIE